MSREGVTDALTWHTTSGDLSPSLFIGMRPRSAVRDDGSPVPTRGGVARAPAPPSDAEVLATLEPEVRAWFAATFPGLTPPQRHAVAHVAAGTNILVASPTGSGKTLAAFLAAISGLVRAAKDGALDDRVHVVYVSPLKALNNDVARNLLAPLQGIRGVFEAAGRAPPAIRVGVRTGDTPASERAAMLRKPPHVLITTPESLAILLSAPRFREKLARVRWVVVDEVHALAANKRGTHLALSLERLAAARAPDAPEAVRVGLSATIAPLEETGRFLFGDRDGLVVDVTAEKGLHIEVRSPLSDPMAGTSEEQRERIVDAVERAVAASGTTIVFTNTRAATERVAFRLRERLRAADVESFEEDGIAAHHGSLSREVRLDVEERLKRGALRCVVTSTSLELGIDVGSVDRVVLLGSPKSVSRALQRVGRSGHRLTEVSRGLVLVGDRDDLVECLVLAREARARRVDAVHHPALCLDVLAQHLLGLALEGEQSVADVLALVRRAHPYRDLPEEDLHAVLGFLAGRRGGAPRIGWDEAEGRFWKRGRMARPVYFQNVGTIPAQSTVRVFHGASYIGELEEAFVEELTPGDVLMLNGRAWAYQYTLGMKAHVEAAPGRRPTVPRWGHESLPLTPDLARQVARFRDAATKVMLEHGEGALATELAAAHALDPATAATVARYLAEQEAFARVPRLDEVVVEESVDDEARRMYVFHAALGRRATEALARAFARTISEARSVSVGVVASDYGFSLTVPRSLVLTAADLRRLFEPEVRPRLVKALESGELVKRRFRHVAERSFMLVREMGVERSVGRQQVSAQMLYHALKRSDREHPVLREAWREVLHDALDLDTAEAYCADVRAKRVQVRFLGNLRTPSPFAFHLVALDGGDGVLVEDRKALLRDLQERVLDRLRERKGVAAYTEGQGVS